MTTDFHTPRTSAHSVNESAVANVPFSELDTAINALAKRIQIIDNTMTAPPASPVNGEVYIPAATASGLWTGHEGKLVFTNDGGTTWIITDPVKGLIVHSVVEGIFRRWDGSSWILANRYIIGGGFNDVPGGGAVITRHRPVISIRFVVDLIGTGSNFYGGSSALAETVFSMKKNGTEFGTITIAASGTDASFDVPVVTDLTTSDEFTIVNQATNDLSFGDIGFAIVGLRL